MRKGWTLPLVVCLTNQLSVGGSPGYEVQQFLVINVVRIS